jgi:putative MATE family efflux protein
MPEEPGESAPVPPPEESGKAGRVDDFIANPRAAVWKLAVPLMLGMVFQTLYSVVNMIFVGWLGGEAIAALTFNMPLVFFSIGITFGLGIGATSVIAQFLGARDKRSADNTAEHALLVALLLGVVVTVTGQVLRRPIFVLLGAPPEVLEPAVHYFSIINLGFIFTILTVQFRAILSGEGDTRTPIRFQVVGTLLNIALDPLLIFYVGLGIAGAAWATLISQFVVFMAFMHFLFVRRGSYLELRPADFAFSAPLVRQVLRIGIPASGSMVIMSVGGMFFNRIIAVFGSHAVAGYGVGGRLDQIYFLPTMALASSMVTLTGMFYGAGRIDLIRRTLNYTLVRGEIIALVAGAVFYVFSPQIFRIFTQDQDVIEAAVGYIRIMVFAFPFITVGMIGGQVFQGLGEGMPGLLLTSMRVIVVSGVLAYVFVYVLHLGLRSVWVALAFASFFTSLIAVTWITRRLRRLEAANPSAA